MVWVKRRSMMRIIASQMKVELRHLVVTADHSRRVIAATIEVEMLRDKNVMTSPTTFRNANSAFMKRLISKRDVFFFVNLSS